jgi:DNA repair protein RecO (recombination protein O)
LSRAYNFALKVGFDLIATRLWLQTTSCAVHFSVVEPSLAILLRKTRLTESSLIVTWLSESHGRIKTVAKGVFRPKSRFVGVLDSLHLCEIRFTPARSGDLHGLREASLVDAFAKVRTDYLRLALAAYAVELIERASEPEFPVPELYDLLYRLLRHLDANPGSPRALRHFEVELVRLLGVAQQGTPAEDSLEALLHRLPANRAELLNRLIAP